MYDYGFAEKLIDISEIHKPCPHKAKKVIFYWLLTAQVQILYRYIDTSDGFEKIPHIFYLIVLMGLALKSSFTYTVTVGLSGF